MISEKRTQNLENWKCLSARKNWLRKNVNRYRPEIFTKCLCTNVRYVHQFSGVYYNICGVRDSLCSSHFYFRPLYIQILRLIHWKVTLLIPIHGIIAPFPVPIYITWLCRAMAMAPRGLTPAPRRASSAAPRSRTITISCVRLGVPPEWGSAGPSGNPALSGTFRPSPLTSWINGHHVPVL